MIMHAIAAGGPDARNPGSASVSDCGYPPRHHIGRFSTPHQRYFAARPLAVAEGLGIVGGPVDMWAS